MEQAYAASGVFDQLAPILSKVAGQYLEVVQENTDAVRDIIKDFDRSCHVRATRVRALRCSASAESLNLAEVHLRAEADVRPQSARSVCFHPHRQPSLPHCTHAHASATPCARTPFAVPTPCTT